MGDTEISRTSENIPELVSVSVFDAFKNTKIVRSLKTEFENLFLSCWDRRSKGYWSALYIVWIYIEYWPINLYLSLARVGHPHSSIFLEMIYELY